MSLRRRLTMTVLALLAAGLIVVPLTTFAVARDFLADTARDQLAQAAGRLAPVLAGGRELSMGDPLQAALGPGLVQLRDPRGTVLQSISYGTPPDLDNLRPPGPQGWSFSRSADREPRGKGWWLRASWLPDGRLLVLGVPASGFDDLGGRLTGVHSTITALALLVLGVFAYRIIRRSVRPLEEIAAAARAIGEGDLSRKVEPADDASEAGRLGLALNEAFRQRIVSEQRLRRFVADASHELRTPVAAIRGYAELFRRGAAGRPDDLALTMSRIESEATRMGVLVDELLLLARLDQGRAVERRPVDLGVLVAEAVAAAHAVEPDRPLTLEVDDVVIDGDAVRLRQLVDNLLANVRRHTSKGTPATVRVREGGEGDSVVIEVDDAGEGIPGDQLDKVFERFYRGDPARVRDQGGAGLGLAIVAAVAHAHGGSATVSSPPGEGARFTVTLPRADPGTRGGGRST
ncbi:sensor histidine kinase [Nonomuraea sp. bgisy101]|uniref:sensor histidine kinase n=1 Tax=Nonomuraea sp. bgisy101 TaxID=3413784 RepID=UPI003D71DE67